MVNFYLLHHIKNSGKRCGFCIKDPLDARYFCGNNISSLTLAAQTQRDIEGGVPYKQLGGASADVSSKDGTEEQGQKGRSRA